MDEARRSAEVRRQRAACAGVARPGADPKCRRLQLCDADAARRRAGRRDTAAATTVEQAAELRTAPHALSFPLVRSRAAGMGNHLRPGLRLQLGRHRLRFRVCVRSHGMGEQRRDGDAVVSPLDSVTARRAEARSRAAGARPRHARRDESRRCGASAARRAKRRGGLRSAGGGEAAGRREARRPRL